MSASGLTFVRGGCPHDCPDTCAWTVSVQGDRAVDLRADPEHPYTRGGLCAKVDHFLRDRVYSSDRILHALRRTGPKGSGEFEQVPLDLALDDIAKRLSVITDRYGGEAVLPYSYMGTQGFVQGSSMDRRFFARLGATNLIRAICGSAAHTGVATTNGTSVGIRPEDLVHSRYIVLWGTNTVVTNLHLWPFIRQAKDNGAKLVVIDPLRTRTARAADLHVRPMPGTDAALALGMMHVIVAEGLHDDEYVRSCTVGFDDLCARLAEYPPARVAELTGLEEHEVVDLARAYAMTRPAVIRLLIGMEHHERGAAMFRAIACLPALTGAWRDLGGGLCHLTAGLAFEAVRWEVFDRPDLARPDVRSVNMVQLGQALTTLDPPIRALFVYASNPATIAPNQNLVRRGLAREDLFTVVHEHFLTDTARYADYVLPATTEVEHMDLLWSWGQTYLTLNLPAIPPQGQSLSNTELFRRLAARMDFHEPYFRESDEQMIKDALDSDHPYLQGITFERLRADGWAPLNLPAPFVPFAEGGFPTASGRAEFYSATLAAQGLDALPSYEPALESAAGDPELAARFPLLLISAKGSLHFLNSSYANVARGLRAEREPRLDIHPADARPRCIADGDWISVWNERGRATLRARVADLTRPGVVAMPSGWWASSSPGGTSANALTSDRLTDRGGGGGFHDTLVEVARTTPPATPPEWAGSGPTSAGTRTSAQSQCCEA